MPEIKPIFPTEYHAILKRIAQISPVDYGKSRNYIDGAVTNLSPYISRGVISTKQILIDVLDRGFALNAIEKLLQELAWRDYWQQIWMVKQDAIHSDLKNQQTPVSNQGVSTAILNATTGIIAIDNGLQEFYKTGYLHNHLRMYIASMACNLAQSHWRHPAQWMYYHLLDGDWASNALSWQWVAGANSAKKYFANQENINKYCHTNQKSTFLDVEYKDFSAMEIPKVLMETTKANLATSLPAKKAIKVSDDKATCLYNYYNLDPNWHKNNDVNRILLLEPSIFTAYPIGKNAMDFMFALADNIPEIKVYVGEFSELVQDYNLKTIFFKEHPLNKNYKGILEERDWMFKVKGYYPSFFGFWKKCKNELIYN